MNNNQRKAFLDMLAWSEGTDNGRQKTRNHGYDVIVGGELFTDYSDHPRKLVTLNPNSNQQAPTLPASFRWWMPTAKQFGLKDFFRKVVIAVALQQIKERGALPMIDQVISVRQIDRCSNIWASLPGAGYGQFGACRQPDCKIQRSGAERSERLMYEQSHRDYLRLHSHHRLPVSTSDHYSRITPLPTKPSATKMPEN